VRLLISMGMLEVGSLERNFVAWCFISLKFCGTGSVPKVLS
jgi:hypothetical protein